MKSVNIGAATSDSEFHAVHLIAAGLVKAPKQRIDRAAFWALPAANRLR
jgi:hypothetical protein